MTELVKGSTDLSDDAATAYAASLLHHYSFELGSYAPKVLLAYWRDQYPVNWIRLAIIEALYQGRYKAVSVEQILIFWQRRQQPHYHFNHEFERLVCDKLPKDLRPPETEAGDAAIAPFDVAAVAPVRLPYHSVALQLPSFKAASHQVDRPSRPRLSIVGKPHEPSPPAADAQTRMVDAPLPRREADNHIDREPLAATEAETADHVDLPTGHPNEHTRGREVKDVGRPDLEPSIELVQPTSHSPIDSGAPPIDHLATTQSAAIAKILQQLVDCGFSAGEILPGFGLTAQSLKPNLRLHLTTLYQPCWLTDRTNHQPIDQFIPDPEPSDFHSKLKAVAQPPTTLPTEPPD